MKQEKKLTQREQEQLSETQSQQTEAREFASAEELLRHDATQTQVPPVIAERLSQSIAKLPGQPKSWWQRWLKR